MVPDLASFLMRPPHEGYPGDYLLARIAGRRSPLGRDRLSHRIAQPAPQAPAPPAPSGSSGGPTAAQAGDQMRREFRWVYLLMDQETRRSFAPLFLWFELRTILVCLRLLRSGAPGRAAEALSQTLLAEGLQLVLRGEREPFSGTDALSDLERALAGSAGSLGTLYRAGEGRAYERRLLTRYLEAMTRLKPQPVLGEFFRWLIDLMNLLSLAKQLRWQLGEPESMIRGGTIEARRLEKLLKEGSPAGLLPLLRTQPGLRDLAALPDNLEQLLLGLLTRKVRRRGRDPLSAGRVLAYLWDCRVEAINAGLVHHAAFLGAEILGPELVR